MALFLSKLSLSCNSVIDTAVDIAADVSAVGISCICLCMIKGQN